MDYKLRIDLREFYPSRTVPTTEEAVCLLDGQLSVKGMIVAGRGRNANVYDVIVDDLEEFERLKEAQISLDVPHYGIKKTLLKPVQGKGFEATGANGRHGDRPAFKKGRLLTFVFCTAGPLKDIRNDEFDKVVETHATLIKPTLYQFHRGTQLFFLSVPCTNTSSAEWRRGSVLGP